MFILYVQAKSYNSFTDIQCFFRLVFNYEKTSIRLNQPSLFIQRVGVVLSGTMSHVIVNDARKAPRANGRGKDVN